MKKKSETQGFRPRPDQREAIKRLMKRDPELTFSMAIRRGLDLFIAQEEKRKAE